MEAAYSPRANEEIQKIQQYLDQHPEIQPTHRTLSHGISTNPLIARMLTLFASYEELHRQIPNEAWKDERVIKAASELMPLSFAISVLALEECREINQTLFEEHARSHHHCQTIYSRLRKGFSSEFENFYTEGKIQNIWNCLYREYVACCRAHPAFSDRFSWLKDDTSEQPLVVSIKGKKTQIFTNYLTQQQIRMHMGPDLTIVRPPLAPPGLSQGLSQGLPSHLIFVGSTKAESETFILEQEST